MTLSDKAKRHLREILQKEFEPEKTSAFTDEDIERIGLFLLTIMAESLKMKVLS
ncbi:MAG: hypothetical protein WAX44_02750 [Minisyncoccia bacterium]